MNKSAIKNAFLIIATIFYIVSAVMLYKGYDKMTNYYNSEYSTSNNVNAYVGGDAYNYIINGNYASGFFILSMGFMIAGTVFMCSGIRIGFTRDSIIQQNEAPNTIQGQLKGEKHEYTTD